MTNGEELEEWWSGGKGELGNNSYTSSLSQTLSLTIGDT